jgi:hypothetical protein
MDPFYGISAAMFTMKMAHYYVIDGLGAILFTEESFVKD